MQKSIKKIQGKKASVFEKQFQDMEEISDQDAEMVRGGLNPVYQGPGNTGQNPLYPGL